MSVLFGGTLPLYLASSTPTVDIVCLFVCFLFFKEGSSASFLVASGLGWAADIYSGGGHGVFLLCYFSAFGAGYVASMFLDIEHPKGQVLFVFSAALARRLTFVPASLAFNPLGKLPDGLLIGSLLGALLTAFLAPVFFFALERIRSGLGLEEER
jgi:hypothetical protein